MKRTVSLLLVALMLALSFSTGIMAASFKDVQNSDYYSVAAGILSDNGILQGYPDGSFGASRAITRAEMATIVCRMIGADLSNQTLKSIFTDVADNHWAIAYISAASERKIINGDGDGTFRPEADVKHEEAIKMVVCALGLVSEDIVIDPVDWSKAYIEIAEKNGITRNLAGAKGYKSTRGDVAVMVYNGLATSVKAPTASVAAGTYSGSKKVTLKSDEKDAQIYYTTNGSTPTTKSNLYTKEITISKSCTLKAIAVVDGISSGILSVEYIINSASGSDSFVSSSDNNFGGSSNSGNNDNNGSGNNSGSGDNSGNEGSGDSEPSKPSITVAKPTSSLKAGRYTIAKGLTLSSETEGAEFYYTLDGSTPTTESEKCEGEITIFETCTFKAIAVLEGVSSGVLTVEYTIEWDEESDAIHQDLIAALEDINNVEMYIGFEGKSAEIMEYVKKDIQLTIEAAENGEVISNTYVRSTFVEDIEAVVAIIDGMTDEEFTAFKTSIITDFAVYTVNALVEHFNINTDYRQ